MRETQRRNLKLRISRDNGETWSDGELVDKKDAETMYSDIVKVGEKEIGVLYERDNYNEIVFKVMKW